MQSPCRHFVTYLPLTSDLALIDRRTRRTFLSHTRQVATRPLGSENLTIDILPIESLWYCFVARTETNRRARFYPLTAAGKKQLGLEVSQFRQVVAAIGRVLEDVEEAG